jgi:hypothetical protein
VYGKNAAIIPNRNEHQHSYASDANAAHAGATMSVNTTPSAMDSNRFGNVGVNTTRNNACAAPKTPNHTAENRLARPTTLRHTSPSP